MNFFFQIVILCTTAVMFGTCMWFALQSVERTSLVYVPAVMFACMSSLLTLITPMLLQELTGNDKVSDQSEKWSRQVYTRLRCTITLVLTNTLFITCLRQRHEKCSPFFSEWKHTSCFSMNLCEGDGRKLQLSLYLASDWFIYWNKNLQPV